MAEIKIAADSGGGFVSLKGPASTTGNATIDFKLPVADGSANQVLKTDGSKNFGWSTLGDAPTVKATVRQTTGITGNTNYDLTLPANCFRVDFTGKNVSMSGSGGPGFRCSQTADGFLDNGQYTYAAAKQGSSTGGGWASGSSQDRFVIYDWIDNSAGAQWMIRAQFAKAGSGNGRHWIFIAEVAEYGSSEYQKTQGICHTDGSSTTENLDKIRFYPDGTSFDSGDITWIAWSTV